MSYKHYENDYIQQLQPELFLELTRMCEKHGMTIFSFAYAKYFGDEIVVDPVAMQEIRVVYEALLAALLKQTKRKFQLGHYENANAGEYRAIWYKKSRKGGM